MGIEMKMTSINICVLLFDVLEKFTSLLFTAEAIEAVTSFKSILVGLLRSRNEVESMHVDDRRGPQVLRLFGMSFTSGKSGAFSNEGRPLTLADERAGCIVSLRESNASCPHLMPE